MRCKSINLVDKLKKIGTAGVIVATSFMPPSYVKGAQEFIRGDVDGDGKITLTDSVKTLNYLFKGNEELECEDAADLDDNGKIDLGDAVYGLGYLFQGKQEPAKPFPGRGYDLIRDGLGCGGEGDLEGRIITQKDIPLTISKSGTDNKPLLYVLGEDVVFDQPGAVIKIQPGVSNIILSGNKRNSVSKIILSGNKRKNIFIGSQENYGIHSERTHKVKIRDLAILSSKESSRLRGIFMDNAVNTYIHNIQIDSYQGNPILITSGGSNTLQHNHFVTHGEESHAIKIQNSVKNIIEDNTIISDGVNSHGFHFINANENIVKYNNIVTKAISSHGGQLDFSSNNYIENNNIENFISLSIGITAFIGSWENMIAKNNIITHQSDSEGIVSSGDNNKITDNKILTYEKYSRGIIYNSAKFNKVEGNKIETFGSSAPGLSFLIRSDFNDTKNNEIITHGDDSDGISIDVVDKGGNSFSDLTLTTYGKHSNALNIVGKSKSSIVTDYKILFKDIIAQAHDLESYELLFNGNFPENFYASLTNTELINNKVKIMRLNNKPFLIDRYWYLDLLVNGNDKPMHGAIVSIYDKNKNPSLEIRTLDNGMIERQDILTQQYKGDDNEYLTPHIIKVSAEGYLPQSREVYFDSNKNEVFNLVP